jgi:hypothetical protein
MKFVIGATVIFSATTALASEGPPTAEEPPAMAGTNLARTEPVVDAAPDKNSKTDAIHPRLFSGVSFGAIVGVAQQPTLLLAGGYGALLFGVGGQMAYNSRGFSDTQSMPTNDKFQMSATVGLQYMLYNRHPVAIGPEIDYATPLSPDKPFKDNTIQTGVAFWYMPSAAPILVGSAWLASFTRATNGARTVDLLTPSIRVALVFP